MIQWHKNDMLNRMYINVGDGKKAAMPRYYKNKIYSDAQRSEIAGYQKGEIEKRILMEIKKTSTEKELTTLVRNKKAAVKAAFRRMEYQSKSRQKTNV